MGILQAITSSFSPVAASTSAMKPKVIIIGAGVSGLSCASELVKAGQSVLVLEARDRIGGRAHTFVDPVTNVSFDLGASFIHGLAGNPLTKLAKEHKLKLFKPDSIAAPDPAVSHIWSPEGPPLPAELSNRLAFNSMRTAFDTSVEYAQERTDALPFDTESLADYALDEKRSALYEGLRTEQEKTYAKQMVGSWDGWTGADFHDVSLKYWQSDVTYSGGDATIVDGYRGIYEPLARVVREHKGSEIILSQEVTSITYDEDKDSVTVETKTPQATADEETKQSFTAEYVLCTLPLGVLQQNPPKFSPPLSFRRKEGINRLQMGLLNKIIITYDQCFWPEKQTFLSFLPSTASKAFLPILANRALFAQNYKPVTGTNTLVFYLGAATGAAMEELTDEQVKDGIHGVLKHHFGKEVNFPTENEGPKSVIVTRWLGDPFSRGSYSYIRPAKEGEGSVPTPYDFAEVARPAWGDKLYFAGEATDPDHYATVHGPLLTGRREASRIMAAMEVKEQGTL